jgi:hypothetical protein
MWVLTCALAIDFTLNVAAFIQDKRRSRNWDRAIAEETAKATNGVPE